MNSNADTKGTGGSTPMIAKDLMPWLFVKRSAAWTPYVKIRSEAVRPEAAPLPAKPARKPGRRPPRGAP
jgi:hypothetical protein